MCTGNVYKLSIHNMKSVILEVACYCRYISSYCEIYGRRVAYHQTPRVGSGERAASTAVVSPSADVAPPHVQAEVLRELPSRRQPRCSIDVHLEQFATFCFLFTRGLLTLNDTAVITSNGGHFYYYRISENNISLKL